MIYLIISSAMFKNYHWFFLRTVTFPIARHRSKSMIADSGNVISNYRRRFATIRSADCEKIASRSWMKFTNSICDSFRKTVILCVYTFFYGCVCVKALILRPLELTNNTHCTYVIWPFTLNFTTTPRKCDMKVHISAYLLCFKWSH